MPQSGTKHRRNFWRSFTHLAVIMIALLLAGCVVSQQTHEQIWQEVAKDGGALTASDYRVGEGDKIKITIFGEKDLSGTYVVDSAQQIVMPLIGTVYVGGLTSREVEDILEQKYSEGYLITPDISAELAESRPFYILGEIRKPGGYNYIPNMSVLNAVAVSGGFTYRADTDDVQILRKLTGKEEVLSVDLTEAVMPGDVITVRERFF